MILSIYNELKQYKIPRLIFDLGPFRYVISSFKSQVKLYEKNIVHLCCYAFTIPCKKIVGFFMVSVFQPLCHNIKPTTLQKLTVVFSMSRAKHICHTKYYILAPHGGSRNPITNRPLNIRPVSQSICASVLILNAVLQIARFK